MMSPHEVPILLLEDDDPVAARLVKSAAEAEPDPAAVILTCANCGAAMDERKCKLICQRATST